MENIDFNQKWANITSIWKEIHGEEQVDSSSMESSVDQGKCWQTIFENMLGESLRFCLKEFDRMNQVSINYRGSLQNRIESLKMEISRFLQNLGENVSMPIFLDSGTDPLVRIIADLQNVHATLIQKMMEKEKKIIGICEKIESLGIKPGPVSERVAWIKSEMGKTSFQEKHELWRIESWLSLVSSVEEACHQLNILTKSILDATSDCSEVNTEFDGFTFRLKQIQSEYQSIWETLEVAAMSEENLCLYETPMGVMDRILQSVNELSEMKSRVMAFLAEKELIVASNKKLLWNWLKLIQSYVNVMLSREGETDAPDPFDVTPENIPKDILDGVLRPWFQEHRSKFLKIDGEYPPSMLEPFTGLPLSRQSLGLCAQMHGAELLERQRKFFQEKVEERMINLKKLWEMLRVPLKDRNNFLDGPIKDILYTEMGITELDRKIETLNQEWREKAEIIKKIQDRQELIKRMIKFEHDASDPARLFKSSFQLVQEEKFRKTAFPTLIKIETELLRKIQAWESDRAMVFEFHGKDEEATVDSCEEEESFLAKLQREMNERYVNETFFGFPGANNEAVKNPRSGSSSGARLPSKRPSSGSKQLGGLVGAGVGGRYNNNNK